MPDVSIIIPTWNRGQLLEKAVRSALAQTLPPLEVLVCDDGSTDGSQQLVQGINDLRVQWLPGLRAGRPAVPRNRGIRESRGEWVAFLDNDDEWLPDKLEKQLRLADKIGCHAVCSNALRFIPGKGAAGNYFASGSDCVAFEDLLIVNRVICSSALVHRSVIEKVQGFPEEPELKALEDYSFWLRVAVFTDFAYIHEPLLFYRDEASSSVRSGDVGVSDQRCRVFGDFLSWGKRSGISPAYLRKVRRRLLRDRAERLLERLAKPAKKLKRLFE